MFFIPPPPKAYTKLVYTIVVLSRHLLGERAWDSLAYRDEEASRERDGGTREGVHHCRWLPGAREALGGESRAMSASKIPGRPKRSNASARASRQKRASRLFDDRQVSTRCDDRLRTPSPSPRVRR